MKQIILVIWIIAITVGCKKKEEEPPPVLSSSPNNSVYVTIPAPSFSNGQGVAIAIKTRYFQWNGSTTYFDTAVGSAKAFFYDASGFYAEVGIVRVEGFAMSRQGNNIYTLDPTLSDPYGVEFSGNILWEAGGGSGIPHFIEDADGQFPVIYPIKDSVIIASSGFTLETTGNISNADSVVFAIYGQGVNITATKPGNASSYTFSNKELANFPKGQAVVQVTAYRYISKTYSGKTIYFVNMGVTSNHATIQ